MWARPTSHHKHAARLPEHPANPAVACQVAANAGPVIQPLRLNCVHRANRRLPLRDILDFALQLPAPGGGSRFLMFAKDRTLSNGSCLQPRIMSVQGWSELPAGHINRNDPPHVPQAFADRRIDGRARPVPKAMS